MKYTHKFVGLAISLLFTLLYVTTPAPATAMPMYIAATDARSEACKTLQSISPENGDCQSPAGSGLNRVITVTVNFLSIVAGVIGVIMLIVGGLKFVMADGDASKIKSARNTIIYVIAGLIVVALAQFIVKFVMTEAS